MYPIISVAALAVMWSTLVALLDACPRVVNRLFSFVSKEPDKTPDRYTMFLAVQLIGVTAIVLFLMGGFVAFLDFATSMGFLAAPAIAYYNYRAVTSPEIALEFRPSAKMVAFSWLSVVSLAGFAISYFAFRFI